MNLDFLPVHCTQFSNELSWYPTFNKFEFFLKSGLSVLLLCTIFYWIFTILIWIFPLIRTIWTSNVHNFPFNFLNIVHSTNLNFSTNTDSLYIECTQIFIKLSWFCTLNELEFFNESGLSVHQMYMIFRWIFTISYI